MAISLFSAFNSETQPLNPGFELCCERLWKGRPMGCLPAGIVPLGTGSWRARTFLRFNCNAGYKIPMMIPVLRLLELATKELALDLLQQAWHLKLEVNTVTYNAAISACAFKNQLHDLHDLHLAFSFYGQFAALKTGWWLHDAINRFRASESDTTPFTRPTYVSLHSGDLWG